MANVEPLKMDRKIDGFEYELVKRTGNVALFKKVSANGVPSYEVCKIQVVPEQTNIAGKHYPAHEKLPSSEQFGTYGWAYSGNDEEGAMKRFEREVSGGDVGESLVSMTVNRGSDEIPVEVEVSFGAPSRGARDRFGAPLEPDSSGEATVESVTIADEELAERYPQFSLTADEENEAIDRAASRQESRSTDRVDRLVERLLR